MFYRYQSSSLRVLARSFSEAVSKNTSDPLEAPWVIVQNNEIKEWLLLKCAEHSGIAANFRFIFPSEFMWMLYRQRVSEVPKQLPGDLNAMQWALFELFRHQPEKLTLLPSFLRDVDDPKVLFRFCGQLADVFDKYQVYRPEMMESWLNEELHTDNNDEKWQSAVWRSLNAMWESSGAGSIPRRSEAFVELMSRLQEDDAFVEKLPEEMFVFGLSQLPRPFLQIVASMAKKKDVHFFNRRGNRHVEENALFETWAKSQSDQLELLDQLLTENSVPLMEAELPGEMSRLPNIEIHSCHNKRREADVLKNEILRYLNTHPDRKPEDILVLVPDAESYAGTLETVFSNDVGEPALPVSRLFGNAYQTHSHSLVQLLELLDTSYKATEVIQLINLLPIREKFGFSESDVDTLENWILQNRIFWGLGEKYDTPYSWLKGVSQILAGFAMEPEEFQTHRNLIPFEGISSSGHVELAAKFSDFIHALIAAEKEIKDVKLPQEWLAFARELVQVFIGDDALNPQNTRLFEQMDKLKKQIDYSEFRSNVSFELIKPWIIQQFNSGSSDAGRFGQGITVSTYVPYRSVPFDFIAMLGMNESTFPRKAVRPDFDLVHNTPQPGDRTLKEDDSLLFLETIQSAQCHLHLSYEGQDQKTENIKLPSILIQQLLETLFESENAVKKHALHPFNKKYFDCDEDQSFSSQQAELAGLLEIHSQTVNYFLNANFKEKKNENDVVSIDEILSFFAHPSRHFIQKQLDIRDYDSFNELNDRESFKLNGLDKYVVDQIMFEAYADQHSVEDVFDYALASALIPEGLAGEKAFHNEQALIEELHQAIDGVRDEKEQKAEILLEVNGTKLAGVLDGICGRKLISYRVGDLKAAGLARHWLKHLILINAGHEIAESYYVYKDKKQSAVIKIGTADIGINPLPDYLDWYLNDQIESRLCFFPETSKAYAEKFASKQNVEGAMAAALGKWESTSYAKGEEEDYYNRVAWRDREPLKTEAFKTNSLRFWNPLLSAQKKEGK